MTGEDPPEVLFGVIGPVTPRIRVEKSATYRFGSLSVSEVGFSSGIELSWTVLAN
jgi:hypothetical protein